MTDGSNDVSLLMTSWTSSCMLSPFIVFDLDSCRRSIVTVRLSGTNGVTTLTLWFWWGGRRNSQTGKS